MERRTEGIEKKGGDGGKEEKESVGCLMMQAQEQRRGCLYTVSQRCDAPCMRSCTCASLRVRELQCWKGTWTLDSQWLVEVEHLHHKMKAENNFKKVFEVLNMKIIEG